MAEFVVGLARTYKDAYQVTYDIASIALKPEDISIIMLDKKNLNDDQKSNRQSLVDKLSEQGKGVDVINVYNIGDLVAIGPMAAALNLEGASAGGKGGTIVSSLTTGLVNAFMDIGFTEDDAKHLHDALKQGDVLVGLLVPEGKDPEEIAAFLDERHLSDIFIMAFEDLPY